LTGGELERVGDLARGIDLTSKSRAARISRLWEQIVGTESARNSGPRQLRGGRLTVATSSSVWAQSLQMISERIRQRLNEALGEDAVGEIVFRPAGWDPGGGADGPRALRADPPGGPSEGRSKRPPPRPLTAEEEAAAAAVERDACDAELGRVIAAAMRASLARRDP